MKKIVVMLLMFACTLCLAGAAFAAEAPFTQKELDRFLETYPGFRVTAEEIGQSFEGVDDPDTAEVMIANEKLTGFLKKNGWDEPIRFFYVMGHCGTGLSIIRAGGTDGSMNSLFAQQKAAIEQMPIPDAQKKEALKSLEESMAEMQGDDSDEMSMDVPPEEMELIKKNQARIEKVLMLE